MSENLEKIQETEVKENVTPKPKRERTEAQKANTEKMRQALLAKHEASRKAKAEAEAEKQKKLEEKLLKKAEAIKKREDKKLKVIESIPIPSDDDNDEELQKPVEPVAKSKPKQASKKQVKKPPTPPPSEDEYDDEDEEEEYVPPPKAPRRQMTQHITPQYYQPQPQYVPQRPIIRYV